MRRFGVAMLILSFATCNKMFEQSGSGKERA